MQHNACALYYAFGSLVALKTIFLAFGEGMQGALRLHCESM